MTRSSVLLLTGALCFSLLGFGCGDSAPKDAKPAADPPAKTDAPVDAPGEGHDDAQEGEIGGTGMEHKEGTVAADSATFTVEPGNANSTGTTSDGWVLKLVSTPAAIVAGPVSWAVEVTAPGGAAVTPGQLLIEPVAQESNTGKKLPLEVTPGDPGKATISFMIETAGTYEVEFHLHRSDGGDSHVKAVFTVA